MVDDKVHDVFFVHDGEENKHVLEQDNACAANPIQGTREAVTFLVIL